jgi:hypothetical protein
MSSSGSAVAGCLGVEIVMTPFTPSIRVIEEVYSMQGEIEAREQGADPPWGRQTGNFNSLEAFHRCRTAAVSRRGGGLLRKLDNQK